MSTPTPAAAPDALPDTWFHGVSFDPATRESRAFQRQDLDRQLADRSVFSWIDIQSPDIAVLNDILRRLGIDLELVGHFDAAEVLPRIVERPECLAFYLYEIEDPECHLDTAHGLSEIEFHRMILVLGADFVITFHRHQLDAVDEVKASCVEAFRHSGRTPGFIAFLFLQRCLYDYAHLNLANDNFLDQLEETVLSGDAASRAVHVSVTGGNILTLKKLVASVHIVLMLLATKRSPFVSDEARASCHEMLQNALAIRGAIDSSRDLLDGVLAAAQAASADRTSEIVRVLTVLSGVLLPLSLITGLYGMNFQHMPALDHPLGYYTVVGLMVVLALALLVCFRRLGWIGGPRGPSDS